jgi:hypothetical protein
MNCVHPMADATAAPNGYVQRTRCAERPLGVRFAHTAVATLREAAKERLSL